MALSIFKADDCRRSLRRNVHRGDLSRGVYPCVCPAGSQDCPVPLSEALHGSLQLTLNGPGFGLDLPA